MQKLLEECQQIYGIKYLEDGDTMIATTSMLQKLQQKLEITEIRDSLVSHKFILNGQYGLFAKSVTYFTNKTKRDEFDKEKICTEIGNAMRAIRKFFKQERFNLGNSTHDMAVFIKKNGGTYELVHFDPNEHHHHHHV